MPPTALFPHSRLRRLRQNAAIRGLVRETRLDKKKLIQPLFIHHGEKVRTPIASMPGIFQFSLDTLEQELQEIIANGIQYVLLFGIPPVKDATGTHACHDAGIIQQSIHMIKQLAPSLLVIADVCFCEYTDHGHCGIIHPPKTTSEVIVDNDNTLILLGQQAVSLAKAGADIIAPSANMDGMVMAIRAALDQAHFSHTPILSYSVKYASTMYGPFREAAQGAPKYGDRATYQMDMANSNEALRECLQDIQEGADMLMVKPAHTYLDVIHKIKHHYPHLPLCAYHTSGEYAMIKAAANNGWINEKQSVLEVLTAIKRAGADFIITYYAKDVAKWLEN